MVAIITINIMNLKSTQLNPNEKSRSNDVSGLDPIDFKISFYKSSVYETQIILPATKMIEQN